MNWEKLPIEYKKQYIKEGIKNGYKYDDIKRVYNTYANGGPIKGVLPTNNVVRVLNAGTPEELLYAGIITNIGSKDIPLEEAKKEFSTLSKEIDEFEDLKKKRRDTEEEMNNTPYKIAEKKINEGIPFMEEKIDNYIQKTNRAREDMRMATAISGMVAAPGTFAGLVINEEKESQKYYDTQLYNIATGKATKTAIDLYFQDLDAVEDKETMLKEIEMNRDSIISEYEKKYGKQEHTDSVQTNKAFKF